MSYIKKVKCSFCGGKLVKVLNLGKIPPVNSFYSLEKSFKVEKFPLALAVCGKCELLQLSTVLDPKQLFQDYHYLTHASGSLVKDLKELAEECTRDFRLGNNSKILDIGSNDGTFLKNFLGKAEVVLGVDPSKKAALEAKKDGVLTETRYFDSKSAKIILKKYGQFDLISSIHNLANIPDINDFLEGIKLILSPSGVLVVEVADAGKMVEEGRFDSIYHEHYNYFSLPVLKRILGFHGFEIFKSVKSLKQGGSIRVFARVSDLKSVKYPGIKVEKYQKYEARVLETQGNLRVKLKEVFGKRAAGFGAPAKGVVLANVLRLNKKHISYIVDSTEFKRGKVLPGTDIPVFGEEALGENVPEYVLIFAWSYAEEIKRKLKKISPVKVVIPFPSFRIVDL